MFERIVVALDGSPASEVVLGPLEQLIESHPAELILTHISGLVPAYPAEGIPALVPDPASDYLAGLERRFAHRRPPVRIVDRSGTPVSGILEVARDEKATLIAMATHGRRGLERLIFGSVTELVLRDSPVPVLAIRIAPELQPRLPLTTLLVPLDGSVESQSAVLPALELARQFGARIVLLRAIDPAQESFVDAEHGLQAICGGLVASGAIGHAFVVEGKPTPSILAACAEHAIDMIVMATHGRTGLARLQGGSVTEEVLRESPVPMVVVRAAPEPALAWRGAAEETV
jgi:nucleotide-binding universal stress UspA family protein